MKLFNEIKPYISETFISEQRFHVQWWHWLILASIILIIIITCSFCFLFFCCSLKQRINRIFQNSYMKSRRPIYKGFKSEAELQINIDNETALVKLDVNKSKTFNNEFKKEVKDVKKLYEKEDIFDIKSDSTSADSLDSFANTNTGFTTLEESPSVYLQTSEFHKKNRHRSSKST